MQMRRCTLVIVTAFLICIGTSLTFDSPALFAAASSAGIFLIIRCHLFLSSVRAVAASVMISRLASKHLIRQGATITITSHVTADIPEGLSVSVHEFIASGMVSYPETVQADFPSHGMQSLDLTYQMTPLTHGDIQLPGCRLWMQDAFFCIELPLTGSQYSGPVIRVQPNPFFDRRTHKSRTGERELNQMRDRQGMSIRSYRKYFQSDDYRSIDWKLSAKTRTLMVREYMGLDDFPPLIIVDLPDSDQDFNSEEFASMIRSITGVIERFLLEGDHLSLLIISGPNIINTYTGQQDLHHILGIIRTWFHPMYRKNSMYRTMSRSDIREQIAQVKKSEASGQAEYTDYFSNLIDIYHHGLMESRSDLFSSKISRIISSSDIDEIHLFALCDGDVSYIQEISRQARYRKIRLRIRSPKERDTLLNGVVSRRLKGEIIEGLV